MARGDRDSGDVQRGRDRGQGEAADGRAGGEEGRGSAAWGRRVSRMEQMGQSELPEQGGAW